MAGESVEDMILELNDIVEQENEKMTEYLQQSLVQQLDAEKRVGSQDNTSDVLDDINAELDMQREAKLDELSALNRPETDSDDSQLRMTVDSSEPQQYSPLDVPDVGDYASDGIPTRTSSGQEYTVIKNPEGPLVATNPFTNMSKPSQSGGEGNSTDYLFAGMDMPEKEMHLPQQDGGASDNGNSGTTISDLYSSTQNGGDGYSGSGYGIEGFGGDDIPEVPDIGFSGLDFNMSGGASEDVDGFGVSDISGSQHQSQQPQSQSGGGSGDVKQVTFMANEKELSSMGL
jgi:hypothetical protein